MTPRILSLLQKLSDTWGISCKKLLEKYQTPEDLLELDTNKLADFLKEHSRGQLGFAKAEKIQEAAQNTFYRLCF